MLNKFYETLTVLALLLVPMPAFAQSQSTLDEKASRGLSLILTRTSVHEGVQLLDAAAREGSDEAKYRLGWLYMQDVILSADKDKAFEYLNGVMGEYETGASILIGVIYAEGSKTIPANRATTERIFGEVATILDSEIEKFKVSPHLRPR